MTLLFVRGQSWAEAATRGEWRRTTDACQVGNTKEGRGSHGFFHSECRSPIARWLDSINPVHPSSSIFICIASFSIGLMYF